MTVIVVDNGSSDDTLAIAQRMANMAVVEPKRGIPYAKQRAMDEVKTDVVMSIDADCVPAEDTWAESLSYGIISADTNVIGVSGPVLPMAGGDRWAQRVDVTPASGRDAAGDLQYAVGCNSALRVPLFRELGGYDPHFTAEDAGLGVKARAKGLAFGWVPGATVFHENHSGWRGYAKKMRAVGKYSAKLSDP